MSSNPTQDDRPISLSTPLGKDVLLLRNFTLHEELGRLFEIEMDLQSTDFNIDFHGILGQPVTVTIDLPGRAKRYLNGIVCKFEQTKSVGELAGYRAVAVPWLWMLTRGADCRIFQKMSIPEILKQVFQDLGFSDYREALSEVYAQKGVCVQYRETHFQFVSRLMEQEGIYYYFEHTQDKHTLVLCDWAGAHSPHPDYETISFNPTRDASLKEDQINKWIVEQNIAIGACTLNDYDYTAPKTIQVSTAQAEQSYAQGGFEYYDAPGGYETPDQGAAYARIRLQEAQARQMLQRGQAQALGLGAGYRFTLSQFPRRDQNVEYLTTAMRLFVTSADFETIRSSTEPFSHRCEFSALRFTIPFRPARITPKPVVHGPQTAVVTGPEGGDPLTPYTSKYGSVKVKFRWDRHSKSDDTSSGWIRVSQISAGPAWGSMFIPRIGNEVIVSFEEGDPDRPIITGRVYNADQMPPLGLPQNSLVSYIIDDGDNAIAMHPKDGNECVLLYSPHNDSLETIGARPH